MSLRLSALFAVALAAASAFALAGPALAKTDDAPVAAAPMEKPPRLVLAISVDQFSADLFARYRRYFVAGLARLQEGAVFPSGYQSHAATETCPGHSTLLTGVHPARSGIIANNWFDPGIARADKRIYCSEDFTNPASTSRDPVVTANNLRVPTLGDRLKAINPASRNVAVSAKDRAVVMMGGHSIDAGYWWKGSTFVTFAGRRPSLAADAQNRETTALLAKGAKALPVPAFCASQDRPISVGSLTVSTGRFALEAGKPDDFRVSPRIDAATVDLAVRLLDELKLGQGAAPDVLSVSLSATDYVGHAYGPGGLEECIQLSELDKSIGRLLAALDSRKIDYAVVLSADHGGADAPERVDQQAYPEAVRVDDTLSADMLAKAVTAATGIAAPSGPLLYGDGLNGDIYIARNIAPDQKARVQAALVDLIRANSQVAAVFTAQQIAAEPIAGGSPQDWTLLQRARASYDAERSGDVLVLLKRGIMPIHNPAAGYIATHGSPWDYDRRVPMLFWRRGLSGFEQPAPVETVDIAPTLAALLGIAVPAGEFDGRCLDIDGSAADTCQIAAK